MKISFGDLSREYQNIKEEIDTAIGQVLNSGWFVLGDQGSNFESEFANYCNTNYCVSCASGTDAIALSLMALDIGNGDEVITTDISAVPTISAISMVGATPVFVDIKDENCLIDPAKIVEKISKKTKAIIPVHLYGQPCSMTEINKIAKKYNLYIIEDACQAHGAMYKNKRTGGLGHLGCFSFYPSKNLGCYGDGGAITTNSKRLYQKLTMLRNYGQSKRYYHDIIGVNSRLDEIQSSILRVKLKYLDTWNNRRREIAGIFDQGIKNKKIVKLVPDSITHPNFHLYVIKTKERKKLMDFMSQAGIQLMIHYPINLHRQKAYRYLNYSDKDFPVSVRNSNQIVSLPMYPYLADKEIYYIINTVNKF